MGQLISKSEGKLWDIDIKIFRVSPLKNLSRALQGPFHQHEITKSLVIEEKQKSWKMSMKHIREISRHVATERLSLHITHHLNCHCTSTVLYLLQQRRLRRQSRCPTPPRRIRRPRRGCRRGRLPPRSPFPPATAGTFGEDASWTMTWRP